MRFLCLVLLSGLLVNLSSCEKILFLFPLASKSHKNVFDPLIHALAARGHDMTVLTPYPTKHLPSNVKEVIPLPAESFLLGQFQDPFEMRKTQSKLSAMASFSIEPILESCHRIYQHPEFQEVISQKYDLVIQNGFINTCFTGVVHKIGAPHILITTFASPSFITEVTGNYLPSSFVPNPMFSVSDRMDFFGRLFNWAGDHVIRFLFQDRHAYKYKALYRKYLGAGIPPPSEIDRNASLIFMNSHFSLTYPRPNLPDNIEVGGMHCRPARPLSKDLDEFLSGAEHGFIFFSLGSIVQAKNMPEEYRQVFIKVFGKLKQRVLWKWETEDMPDLPSNVKLSKWLPQQDILGHPNIKVFMTHGGLLSTQEAVYHGVPMLGFPMFGDQDLNMLQAEAAGYAIKFEILELTEELLEEKLTALLNQPQFSSRAKYLSAVFRDQPETPVERAVYWSEYVMRHKGAKHLASAARELNYFQIHSMDVIGFILLVLATALYLLKLTCGLLIRKCCGKVKPSTGKNKTSSKKNN